MVGKQKEDTMDAIDRLARNREIARDSERAHQAHICYVSFHGRSCAGCDIEHYCEMSKDAVRTLVELVKDLNPNLR